MKLKRIKIQAFVMTFTLFILIGIVSSTTSFDWALDAESIVAKGTVFVSRLLCLLLLATPPIVLAFILIGGIYYVGSADDPGKRRVAKNIVMNGIIGGICVIALIAIANSLGIPVDPECFGGGGGSGGNPVLVSELISPDDTGRLVWVLMLIVSIT